ncbi:sigma-70 family RNA polymerase sigma factor [Fortiea contorta]|uniref:sigma-70 family RNA polymerase sigma factor n=1 Tax=Fortiea contorta TaxID=1892405 RepID=UPI0003490431|nr:sigma-70 family RNA polymerase sigma factor [Fortiea contorta]
MRSRQEITELFTTFLQFEADRAAGWSVDAKLRRNLTSYQTNLSQPENSANFWVYYLYKLWQEQPQGLVKWHFSAYLQEVCYWTVYKIVVNLSSTHNSVSDCFQMAIARVDKVLKGYKPDIRFHLHNYATAIFGSELKEMLRSQNEIDICTNWRLLRKITQKRLVESLQNLGLGTEIIQRYVLCWKCYQALYAPKQPSGSRKLPQPDEATWTAIAQLYNSQRYTQFAQPGPEANPEIMEKWLVGCAKAVRDYLYPNMSSLNAAVGNDESGEFQDILPQLKQDSLMTEIVAHEELQERQSQQLQISSVLVAAIQELDAQGQEILQLYYNQNLTQQQIAQQLGIKQYTISRRLTKAKDSLLLKLANWSQQSLHTSLNSLVLNYISTILEEWLKTYYNRTI